jgi:hypothetical protein
MASRVRAAAAALLLLLLLACGAPGGHASRQPRHVWVTSARRPWAGPVRWGKAVSLRERALIVQLYLRGASYAAISRLPLVGRHPQTVAGIVKRALTDGTLARRDTGGVHNAVPKLNLAALFYLRVRAQARPARAHGCGSARTER